VGGVKRWREKKLEASIMQDESGERTVHNRDRDRDREEREEQVPSPPERHREEEEEDFSSHLLDQDKNKDRAQETLPLL
jgi:hypothetical protein